MRSVIFVLFLISPVACFAWGRDGQEIVVKIAENYLNAKVKNNLSLITNDQPLSSFSFWADTVRRSSEWNHTSKWHYVNLQKTKETNPPKNLIEALDYIERELLIVKKNEEKLILIKFLIHLVGDMHQPLHTARSSDRGGNSVKLKYLGRMTNLHTVWDSLMLKEMGLDSTEYAKELITRGMSRDLLTKKFDPYQVLTENSDILDFVYSFEEAGIDTKYVQTGIKLSEERLWAGGLRLASYLNELFDY